MLSFEVVIYQRGKDTTWGGLQSISQCLDLSPGSVSTSIFLIMQTLGGRRSGTSTWAPDKHEKEANRNLGKMAENFQNLMEDMNISIQDVEHAHMR